ncbi:MAG: MaoC family dehydratase N-terminal domain-containing protein [Deltaproteobacteria bacterium]|nr:MaoC family dehydratase N-terminal domain-containing protein [Deltaproteobacteria bacterium]
MIDRSAVGAECGPYEFEVEKGAIRAFAGAIGDGNPLYHDEAYARRQGYAGLVAPPTFPQTFKMPLPGLEKVDKRRTLHGAQEFLYERPLVAGDVLRCTSKLVDVFERAGKQGVMTFCVVEIRGEEPGGKLVFRCLTTIIHR